ncbi:MAG TPA: right-handed parallel beta-helix repeat-containing protein [Candidatus Acidoferrales bacterium]|nr:right-handed parallel beta-helix repeat-containing protein [Candidatus Acidoferrales bacterium]
MAGCGTSPEARVREMLATQKTGVIHLPRGVIEISSELKIAPGAYDLEIEGEGTLLKASDHFQGRAILSAENAQRIRLRNFSIDGNRYNLTSLIDAAPPENAFRIWYSKNGLLFDQVQGLTISNIELSDVLNFPILVSRSSDIKISTVTVSDSGSQDHNGRNNLSGGILIEEGSSHFEVTGAIFHRISGNALWTHSLRTSPRLQDGLFADNQFDTIGRDAIEVGHATRVRVENNSGIRIGYPESIVDKEHGGIPVAIDTAGNVDSSVYSGNRFQEVDGKCFDLDGFHDGAVRNNQCVNKQPADVYPFGHFGIVMNNTDPDAHSGNIEISSNTIDGTKFGGLFVMGSGNRIVDNQFLNLDTSGCNESAAKFGCIYKRDEPKMLESGIYLGRGVARLEQTRGNTIRGNRIFGHKMKTRCIVAGPGVSLQANTITGNVCSDNARPSPRSVD